MHTLTISNELFNLLSRYIKQGRIDKIFTIHNWQEEELFIEGLVSEDEKEEVINLISKEILYEYGIFFEGNLNITLDSEKIFLETNYFLSHDKFSGASEYFDKSILFRPFLEYIASEHNIDFDEALDMLNVNTEFTHSQKTSQFTEYKVSYEFRDKVIELAETIELRDRFSKLLVDFILKYDLVVDILSTKYWTLSIKYNDLFELKQITRDTYQLVVI
jgi:hypothetical protein